MIELLKVHFIGLLLISLGSQVKSDASDHRYIYGDIIPVYASKVGPYSNPLETYDYHDLPFCSPDSVKEVNLSKNLIGEHLVPTPYKVEFLVDKEFELLCNKRLKKADVSQFRSIVEKDYTVHWYYDDLPIPLFFGGFRRDVSYERMKRIYFLYKHFDFNIFYNKDRVIDVLLQIDPNSVLDVTEDKEVDVVFTYSVKWMVTQDSFDDRMHKYKDSSNPDSVADHITEDNNSFHTIHGYSILNSSFTILILIICILVFYKRVLQKDISRYTSDVEEAEMTDNQEETGWKNIRGDVFRFPKHKSLYSAALGCGSQLLVLMVVILNLGVIGIFQPSLQGVFLKACMIVYAFTFVISGYTSVSFYHQLEGTNWKKNLLLTGGLYFGPLFLTFTFSNMVAIFNGSTAPLSLGAITMLSLLWVLLALSLLLLGGFIGKNKKTDFQAPCRTAKCPREIPRLRWYKRILPQMVLAGLAQFSVINILLHDTLYIVWEREIYIFYNSMSIMFFLLLITTILVSVVMTYFQLAAENHEWWWRSFFIGGSTGLYIYGYSIYYYFCLSAMNGFIQTSSFFLYMACISYGFFLLLGTVGFHASLFFIRYLYASIKCD